MVGIKIVATGRCLPEKVVTNDDLSKIVDTSDEWITTRTGIKERYHCVDEKNWQLAAGAAKKAMESKNITPEQIGVLVVATFTPDYATPSVACILQRELGLPTTTPAFDINAACSGFLYGLRVAGSLLADSDKPYALVIGSEQISTRLDMTDRGTCVLFGDGAGAAVIELQKDKEFIGVWGNEGNVESLGCPGQAFEKQHVYMDGQTVFKFAVRRMTEISKEVLAKANMTIDDLDHIVCHQANERIVSSVRKQLGAPEEKVYMNMARYGNTSAACIPIALDEMNEKQLIKPGDKMLLVGFGAGFTWGSMILEW